MEDATKLYRQLARLHRTKLDGPMRVFGDAFIRLEFRKHLSSECADNQWETFIEQWTTYQNTVSTTQSFGRQLPDSVRSLLSEDQKETLRNLRLATKGKE